MYCLSEEKYTPTDQIRRSSCSICATLASPLALTRISYSRSEKIFPKIIVWQTISSSRTVLRNEKSVSYRNHRPGWLVFGRASALQGVRGPRHHQTSQHL